MSGPAPAAALRLRRAGAAALLLAASAACTAEATPSGGGQPSPFADCTALTAPPPSASASPPAVPVSGLPDLRLTCFTGEEPVALRDLRGPAVINVWASWCGPCRTELPVMQTLADRAAGRLTVLGVDTGDRRDAGASFAADKGVAMPTLFDPDRKLITALTVTGLPVTIFLDAAGRSHVYARPLDATSLAAQVRTHTGVTVTL